MKYTVCLTDGKSFSIKADGYSPISEKLRPTFFILMGSLLNVEEGVKTLKQLGNVVETASGDALSVYTPESVYLQFTSNGEIVAEIRESDISAVIKE